MGVYFSLLLHQLAFIKIEKKVFLKEWTICYKVNLKKL